MTIKLHFDNFSTEHVGFSYSVLRELLLSLHTLNHPKQRPLHITWGIDVNRRLSAELRAEYRWFRPIISSLSNAVNLLWSPDDAQHPDFAQEFNTFSALTPTQFAEPLLADFLVDAPPTGRRIWESTPTLTEFQQSPTLRQQATNWLDRHYPESPGLLTQLYTEPEQIQARFLMLLQVYWDTVFADEWARLEAYFSQELAIRGRSLMHDGVLAMVSSISDRFSADSAQQQLTYVSNGPAEQMTLGTNDWLNLYPSYFTFPSLIFSFSHDKEQKMLTISITYPMPQQQYAGKPPVPPERLLTILRAASDATRLQILQLVAEKPRSTSELAQIIRVSDAAISKQLKQLQRAGWVEARRESYYVLYSASTAPLLQLTSGLATLLENVNVRVKTLQVDR